MVCGVVRSMELDWFFFNDLTYMCLVAEETKENKGKWRYNLSNFGFFFKNW